MNLSVSELRDKLIFLVTIDIAAHFANGEKLKHDGMKGTEF